MKWRSVLVLSTVLVVGISFGIGLRVLRLQSISATLTRVIPAPDARAARAIYPYSLIPGGVRNSYELSQSIAQDPVLAEHYRDLRPAALFPMRLTADTQAYVSYRVGNQIFWTRHLVRIARGELVLTDGYHMVRGRCGNQIMPAYLRPKAIPSTLDPIEPPAAVFEAGYPPVMTAPPDRALLAENSAPALPVLPGTPAAGAPPVFWPPVVPPVAWCCTGSTQTGNPAPVPPVRGGNIPRRPITPPPGSDTPPPTTPPGGGDTPTPPTTPPVSVPEPGTLAMLGMGLVSLLFGRKLL